MGDGAFMKANKRLAARAAPGRRAALAQSLCLPPRPPMWKPEETLSGGGVKVYNMRL